MSEVEWRYGDEISFHLIEAFEAEFGVRLPASYRDIARRHDASIPFPSGVAFPDPDGPGGMNVLGLGQLISFVPDEGGVSRIAEINRRYRDAYPGFIVFSEAGNGWHFAFEYQPGKETQSVVLFTFDNMSTSGCIEVARSFDELVAAFFTEEEYEPSAPET